MNRPMTRPHHSIRIALENAPESMPPVRMLLEERDSLLRDIQLVLDNPGTHNGLGSWNAERTYCEGCSAQEDGWHAHNSLRHEEGCPTAAGNEAEKRLREILRREGLQS